ncbi:MAG: hypothetical protein ACRDHF_04705 [Tepidiformaceae bacterium]
MSDIPVGGLPQHRRLVEQSRRAADAESEAARAEQWRRMTTKERGELIAQLLNLASFIGRNRVRQSHEPPLNFPRFSTRREHWT